MAAGLRFLAILGHIVLSSGMKTRVVNLTESCSPLKNRQSYSALRVGVGTPAQWFDLVADTGSSAVIVTHCDCRRHSCYGSSGKCFKGKHHSSTFDVPRDATGDPLGVAMQFGSGTIYGVVGTDVVTVGQTSALMNGSVVFMYDHELDTDISAFEGIFGLGLPYRETDVDAPDEQSWLATASIRRFSMCFSNMKDDGMLRLNSPAQKKTLGNLGKYHWGLDFQGVSIGEETSERLFCGEEERKGRETACGLIPDSGTTLILAPTRHIWELYASLCDRWPRCQKAFAKKATTADESEDQGISSIVGDWIKDTLEKWGVPDISNPFSLDPDLQEKVNKKNHFESLLADCESWAPDAAALDDEVPPLFWHVAGAEGSTQTLKLPASTYIVASGYKNQVVCMPFFGEYNYETRMNGPIWIMGTALFYQYEVHYDLSTTPASISFTSSSCGSCGDNGVAVPYVDLLRRRNQRLRRQDGKVRMPVFNTSLPF